MADYAMSGLSINRSNNVITFGWKWGPDVTPSKHQAKLEWKLKVDGAYTAVTKYTAPTKGTTSYSITLDFSQYYPTTTKLLNAIWFRVHYGEKRWTEYEINFTTADNFTLNVSGRTFSWQIPAPTTGFVGIFTDVEIQSVNDPAYSEDKVDWSRATVDTGTNNDSETYSDTTNRRWVRIRSRGPAGASNWVCKSARCASPNTPVLTNASYSGTTAKVTMNYSNGGTYQNAEVTSYDLQYCIATPASGMVLPAGATFTTGKTISGSTTSANVSMTVPSVGEDKAIWLRAVAHSLSGATATSTPILAGFGALKNPTLSSCTWNTSTKQVTATFTNGSAVPGTKVALVFADNKILASNGTSSLTATYSFGANVTQATFGIFTYYGDPSRPTMKSATVWQTQDVTTPKAPTVTGSQTKDPEVQEPTSASAQLKNGAVELSWAWDWATATGAIISWADDPNAWMSTNQPSEFRIETKATKWLVNDLELGKTWYFKVRLFKAASGSDGEVLGPWSDLISLNLTSAPLAPSVALSSSVVKKGDILTVYWAYTSTDDTLQKCAEIYVDGSLYLFVNGAATSVNMVANWNVNTSHAITVKVTSESGKESAASVAAPFYMAPVPSITVTNSLVAGELTEMPLTVSVSGAGTGGQTLINVLRYGTNKVVRPNGKNEDGFDGETIYTRTFNGAVSNFNIGVADLVGRLDDGAYYVLECTIYDRFGQKATSSTLFKVAWSHQAEMPDATVEALTADKAVKITPIAPASYVSGDKAYIYRLSKDKPELIMIGDFGETYVDPYPASKGGYRVVDYTANGDYLTEVQPAWVDKPHGLVIDEMMIDFDGGESIVLPFNLTVASSWSKDFKRTVYLNGSVQGDWNKAVTRDATLSTVTLKADDELIERMRELADNPQICHVRTPDGSSYDADLQVSESAEYGSQLVSFDIKAQRIDPQEFEAMTLQEWNDRNDEGSS